jgi:hypothetical protein
MNCVFCLEPMNEGARVCKTCGRKQPASRETVRKRIHVAIAAVVAVAITTAIVSFFWYQSQREGALQDARAAAAFCHPPGIDSAFAEAGVEKLHDAGASWAEAAKAFRVLIGCDFSK